VVTTNYEILYQNAVLHPAVCYVVGQMHIPGCW